MITHVVKVTGASELNEMWRRSASPETKNTIRRSMLAAAKQWAVPLVAAAAPRGKGMKGRYPHAAGNLKRSIKAARARIRTGEIVAVKVGPSRQAWYAHFVIRGTRPHIIQARGLSPRGVRSFNRALRGGGARGAAAKALLVSGALYPMVHHPGATANPFNRDAHQADAMVVAFLAYELKRRIVAGGQ